MRIRTYLRHATGTLALLAAASVATPAHAGERISLRNGFDMRCDHHAQVGAEMRLYTTSGNRDYIVLRPEEITSVELVPDLPAQSSGASSKTLADTHLTAADLHEMLTAAGQEHNIDVDLLASVVKAESNGNAHAVSRAGARGLMQLMPLTAAGMGVNDSFKPDQNVRGGAAYLDWLLARYHDNLGLALAAYNAGPGPVDRYHGIPPFHETRVYVARVIHEYNRRVRARQANASAALTLSHASP